MLLMWFILFSVLALLYFGIVLIGARNPSSPKFFSENWVANFHVPLIVFFVAMGISYLAKIVFVSSFVQIDVKEIAISVGIGIGGLLIFKMMNIKKRLAKFEAQTSGGIVIPLADVRRTETSHEPPSVKPTNGRKAA